MLEAFGVNMLGPSSLVHCCKAILGTVAMAPRASIFNGLLQVQAPKA